MLIKNKLYNGTVELNFDSFRHKYTLNGEEIKSVTKILSVIAKPALISWASNTAVNYVSNSIEPGKSYDELELHAIWEGAKKAHWEKKVEAGNLGTFLHKWVESYIKGENPGSPVNPQLERSVLEFLIWVKKHKVKFLLSEQVVYSKKYKYCGTTDFICKIDGKMYIGDLKTSSGIYPEMLLQTAAYRQARGEEYPKENYAGQLILRIGKNGEMEFMILDDPKVNKRMLIGFISALKLSGVLDTLEKRKS